MEINDIKRIGIIGAGLMGHGIAQLFAVKGYTVNIHDADQQVLKSVPERVEKIISLFTQLQLINETAAENCRRNINLCDSFETACEQVDLVIEAVSENLEVKQRIFERLERNVNETVILCSNTSAINIGKICEHLQYKQRVLGTHFWNPPHIVPCVEVIKSEYTSDAVFNVVFGLLRKVGKQPVRVLKDVPGFLGNRLQHAMWREAISLAANEIASPEDIDNVVKYGFGLRCAFIGPLETSDLAGLDLTYEVQEYLFPYLENETSPSRFLKEALQRKILGVKTGKGFYDWPEEKKNKIIQQRDTTFLNLLQLLYPE